MDKETIKVNYLLILLLTILSMNSYSQDLYTKELKWDFPDSTGKMVFHNKEEILEWSKDKLAFSTTYLKDLIIKNHNILIVIVDGCSGIACYNIYVFKETGQHWQIITSSRARLIEKIDTEVENDSEKLIFKTKSGQIGELPFTIILKG